MEFKKDWNFENDHKLWLDIVRKSFSELTIQSSKQNFHYPFEQQWSNQTCLDEREENVTHPKLIIKNISLSDSVRKKLNIDKTISEKKAHKYHCNPFLHHARGMDGNWEVVFALYDFLNLCQTGKIKKTIEILSVVDHNFFYQQVKNLSLVIILKHILKAFHIRLPINVDIAVSDRMFTNTDPKNNLVRLTYALQAALLLRPRYILQSPLKGFSTEESWRLVSQAFNVLRFESDLLKTSNPYAGAVFFENAVVQFCHKVWEDLQSFLKLPNEKKRQGFYRDIVSNFMKDRKNKYLDKKIKVVGVNDFISPV